MTTGTKNSIEKRRFIYAAFVPLLIAILISLVFILEEGMGWNFHKAGIYPRKLESIWGIFTSPFIHADFKHLINNLVSFLALGVTLYYFYGQIATKVLLIAYFFSGLILWVIGRESWHIGASGIIYTLAFFLFFSGLIRRYIPLIAISLVVVFLYGNMVWYIFPFEANREISWEGHLAGAVTGSVCAIIFKNKGPQKPEKIWDDEEDENTGDALNEEQTKEEKIISNIKKENLV
jgi:membrane associated rhomboid family serine protease